MLSKDGTVTRLSRAACRMFEVDRSRYIQSSITVLVGSKTTLTRSANEGANNPIAHATIASVKRALQKVLSLTDGNINSSHAMPIRPVSTPTTNSISVYQQDELIVDHGVVKQLILSQRSSGVHFPL